MRMAPPPLGRLAKVLALRRAAGSVLALRRAAGSLLALRRAAGSFYVPELIFSHLERFT